MAIVSLHPPSVPGVPPERRIDLSPLGPPAADGTPGRTGLSELLGQLKGPTESAGGALVYLDAVEYYASEEGVETTIRALNWLLSHVRATGSALLVSFDARSLDPKEAARLERAFPTVL